MTFIFFRGFQTTNQLFFAKLSGFVQPGNPCRPLLHLCCEADKGPPISLPRPMPLPQWAGLEVEAERGKFWSPNFGLCYVNAVFSVGRESTNSMYSFIWGWVVLSKIRHRPSFFLGICSISLTTHKITYPKIKREHVGFGPKLVAVSELHPFQRQPISQV